MTDTPKRHRGPSETEPQSEPLPNDFKEKVVDSVPVEVVLANGVQVEKSDFGFGTCLGLMLRTPSQPNFAALPDPSWPSSLKLGQLHSIHVRGCFLLHAYFQRLADEDCSLVSAVEGSFV